MQQTDNQDKQIIDTDAQDPAGSKSHSNAPGDLNAEDRDFSKLENNQKLQIGGTNTKDALKGDMKTENEPKEPMNLEQKETEAAQALPEQEQPGESKPSQSPGIGEGNPSELMKKTELNENQSVQ